MPALAVKSGSEDQHEGSVRKSVARRRGYAGSVAERSRPLRDRLIEQIRLLTSAL
jgi:hypothetical protein